MEITQSDISTNNIPQTKKRFFPIKLFILVSSLLLLLTLGYITIILNKPFTKIDIVDETPSAQKLLPTDMEDKQAVADSSGTQSVDEFLSYWYKDYKKFQQEVPASLVKRVFFIQLFKFTDNEEKGWVVEVEKEPQKLSYYLLTPLIEKELENPKSCTFVPVDPPIDLERVDTVGNDKHRVTSFLKEPKGYLVLSGRKNSCYGGAGTGFISVYNLSTGEKIRLHGNFEGLVGISETGNALGYLKGIYGLHEPTIVVEYGNFDRAASNVEELTHIAFFDLQTGSLKQLIEFK